MIELAKTDCEENDQDYWNINDENSGQLTDLLKLLVQVIPIAYIFRCKDCNEQIRLIIITDQHQYQDSDKTKTLLNFVSMGRSNIHLAYFCYGTMFDFLQRGHIFFSVNCTSANCIFKKKDLIMLPARSDLLTKITEDALRVFNLEMEKVSSFFYGAEVYFKENKLNMAAFMLHQTCEQLYRLIILIFRRKDFKSHHLQLLRKEAAFYYPQIYNMFHIKETKELKWITLLQDSYLGVRYQDDYFIKPKNCIFLKEKIEEMLLIIKTELFQSVA